MATRRWWTQAAVVAAVITGILGLIGECLTIWAPQSRGNARATEQTTQTPEKATLRFPLSLTSEYFPSGWMGDGEEGVKYLTITKLSQNIRGENKVATKIVYRGGGPKGFAGVYWQHPDGNSGGKRGLNLTGARSIAFLARGEKGGEIVEFFAGGSAGQPFPDSFSKVSIGDKVLTTDWQQFEIGLDKLNLANVVGAFAWSAPAPARGSEITFYIADLQIQ